MNEDKKLCSCFLKALQALKGDPYGAFCALQKANHGMKDFQHDALAFARAFSAPNRPPFVNETLKAFCCNARITQQFEAHAGGKRVLRFKQKL